MSSARGFAARPRGGRPRRARGGCRRGLLALAALARLRPAAAQVYSDVASVASAGDAAACISNPDCGDWKTAVVENVFQPSVTTEVLAGTPFRLSVKVDPSAADFEWEVREPLPQGIVDRYLGKVRGADRMHFDLNPASALPAAGDPSGYLIVGYRNQGTWFTQPVALKLVTALSSEQERLEVDEELLGGTAYQKEFSWRGFFFVLFVVLDITIAVGLAGHYYLEHDTWRSPPAAEGAAADPRVGAGSSRAGGSRAVSARGSVMGASQR